MLLMHRHRSMHIMGNFTPTIQQCSERPPDERPISMIVSVDPFGLQYLPSQEMKRKDIKRLNVNQGEMVMFTNTCLHSGNTNESDNYRLRLFEYLVSHEEDFPKKQSNVI